MILSGSESTLWVKPLYEVLKIATRPAQFSFNPHIKHG